MRAALSSPSFIPLGVALVAGFFLAASASIPGTALSFFAGIVLLFFSIRCAQTPRFAFLSGLLAGTLYMAAASFAIIQLHPLAWAGIMSTRFSLAIVLIVWASTSLFLGASVGLFAWFVKVAGFFPRFSQGIVFAAVWVLTEKLRAFIPALLFYGSGSSLIPHHAYTDAGYFVSQLHLFAQFLPWGGVPLASFAALLVAWFLFVALEDQKIIPTLALLGLLAAGNFIVPAPNAAFHGAPATLGIVTTSFEPDFSVKAIVNRTKSLDQLLSSLTTRVDALVLPENSFYLRSRGVTDAPASEHRPHVNATIVVDSSPSERGHELRYYRPDSEETSVYRKIVLMPQGEYLMWWEVFITKFLDPLWLSTKQNLVGAMKGDKVLTVEAKPGLSLGGLLCSERASPYLFRALVEEGATILINPSSHSVFHGSVLLAFQTRVVAQARAMELGRYLIVAGNATESLVISPQGALIAKLPSTEGSLSLAVVTVESVTKRTLFVRAGEWVVYVSGIITALSLFLRYRMRRKKT